MYSQLVRLANQYGRCTGVSPNTSVGLNNNPAITMTKSFMYMLQMDLKPGHLYTTTPPIIFRDHQPFSVDQG